MDSNTISDIEELLKLAQVTETNVTMSYDPRLSDVQNFVKYFKLVPGNSDKRQFRVPVRALYKLYLEFKKKFSIVETLSNVAFGAEIRSVFTKSDYKKFNCVIIYNSHVVKERIKDRYFVVKKRKKKQKLTLKQRIARSEKRREKAEQARKEKDKLAWKIHLERQKRYQALKEEIIKSKSSENTKSQG